MRPIHILLQTTIPFVRLQGRCGDRDGWQRALSLDITNENGTYSGSWMSMEWQPGVMLDRIDVDGDKILSRLVEPAHLGWGGRP